MRRAVKVKALAPQIPLRKAALSASAAARRSFPAWISADDSGVAFTARIAVTPRVRDGLVLRRVSKKKISAKTAAKKKGVSDGHRGP
jgi:hypothetical protein